MDLNDLDYHNKSQNGVDPFNDVKNYLQTDHAMDDLFHRKEMDQLFPGHSELKVPEPGSEERD